MDLQETGKNVKTKAKQSIKDNMQKLLILAVSALYVAQGLFSLQQRETTVIEVLGNIGISLVVGIFISSCFNSMGLKDGRNSELFVGSVKAYGVAKEKATPFFDKLSAWCDYKNTQDLLSLRRTIIQEAGLNWKAYRFGYYDEHQEKLNDRQKEAIKNAKNAKILKLNSQELLSDLPITTKGKIPFFGSESKKFGEDKADFQRRTTITNAITKIGMGLVCGLYTLIPLITKDNAQEYIAGVIWHSTQIAMWLIFGYVQYFGSKSFMEDEYRQTHIIQKTEYLNEFVITIQNNPDIINNEEEEIEIDKYIQEFINSRKAVEQSQNQEVESNE